MSQKMYEEMQLEEALRILHIVKCDCLGYCRDLSYTPTHKEVGCAIKVIENYIEDSANK